MGYKSLVAAVAKLKGARRSDPEHHPTLVTRENMDTRDSEEINPIWTSTEVDSAFHCVPK